MFLSIDPSPKSIICGKNFNGFQMASKQKDVGVAIKIHSYNVTTGDIQ